MTQTDRAGSFELTLPNLDEISGPRVAITVSTPSGLVAAREAVSLEPDPGRLRIVVDRVDTIPLDPAPDPSTIPVRRLTGRVFDVNGRVVPSALQIVLYGGESLDDVRPLTLAQTESNGYFKADYPTGSFAVAVVRVASVAGPVTVTTVDGHIPNPLLVGITLDELDAGCGCGGDNASCGGGCGAGKQVVPRAPDSADLANSPETYSTDLGTGGCVQFNVPNRSVDEFDFYSVIRTTEPEIRGLTVGAPAAVVSRASSRGRNALLARLAVLIRRGDLTSDETTQRTVELLRGLTVVPDEVEELLVAELRDDPLLLDLTSFNAGLEVALATAALNARGEADRQPGRAVLDASNPVDWDSSPTFYEAATIAHGHLLHFKQVWYADGYSLGDLLYSLPLAPGQKRIVAVLDWERRDQADRSEGTFFSEGLQASLSRDRDLNEVVSGTLSESLRGGSTSETAGVGVGTGAAGNGSYQGFNFGALLGISGGYGSSNATAWQESARTMGAQSMQRLRDVTLQSASSIRGLRSTVVHSATQGESVRASTEVVANHNRCHAMTVQYFEVLRHLRVELELADVQECLFIPLPMSSFDATKALRWSEPLSVYLRDSRLAGGFDALNRVETNWSEVDEPAGRYADELVTAIYGEMDLSLFVPMPPIPEAPPPDPGKAAVDAVASIGEALNPTKGFLGALLAVATGGASLIAGAVTSAVTAGASATAEALARTPTPEAKYAKFHREVMPGLVAGFVDQLELWMVNGGVESRVGTADFTLVSDYRTGSPMLVGVRATLGVGVPRSAISRLVIKSRNGLPSGCRAVVNRAVLRYRTSSFEHVMVDDERVNDDIDLPSIVVSVTWPTVTVTQIASGSGVALFTPIDTWEQRSPRKEDRRLAGELIRHLNDNLEYYHQALWWRMDPSRRYMLLDGYVAPNSGGRSVASVTENRLIGVVGNSLVMPVARGVHLDPRFAAKSGKAAPDLREYYRPTTPIAPSRISLPTRGVFAEAVLGNCNSCEQIDDTRLWRWEDAPLDEVPGIEALSTASRRAEPIDSAPTTFPSPMVAIQNAPNVPDPAGVLSVVDLLGKASTFPDLTGLAATQGASLAAYTKALDTAQAFGKEASTLAQQAAMTRGIDKSMDAINKAESSGGISSQEAASLRVAALRKMVGGDDGLTSDKVKERLDIVDEAAAKGSIGKGDATELNKQTLGKYVRIDEPAKPESEAAAKKIDEIEPGSIDKVEIGPGSTVVTARPRRRRRINVILTARYADDGALRDAIFPAQFDLGLLHEPTGTIKGIAFDTSTEGTAQAWLEDALPGSYSILGRIARTTVPALVASGQVTIVGAAGPFTIDVPFDFDNTASKFFTPTGNFTLPVGASSVALLAAPATSSKTVKTTITLSAGLAGEAEYSSEISAKVGGSLAKVVEADIEGKSAIALKASGNVNAGQTTEFEVTYRRITGIRIVART